MLLGKETVSVETGEEEVRMHTDIFLLGKRERREWRMRWVRLKGEGKLCSGMVFNRVAKSLKPGSDICKLSEQGVAVKIQKVPYSSATA